MGFLAVFTCGSQLDKLSYPTPEKEDIKRQSNREAFLPDTDGLQDPRVAQLCAHQLHIKYTRLLYRKANPFAQDQNQKA